MCNAFYVIRKASGYRIGLLSWCCNVHCIMKNLFWSAGNGAQCCEPRSKTDRDGGNVLKPERRWSMSFSFLVVIFVQIILSFNFFFVFSHALPLPTCYYFKKFGGFPTFFYGVEDRFLLHVLGVTNLVIKGREKTWVISFPQPHLRLLPIVDVPEIRQSQDNKPCLNWSYLAIRYMGRYKVGLTNSHNKP